MTSTFVDVRAALSTDFLFDDAFGSVFVAFKLNWIDWFWNKYPLPPSTERIEQFIVLGSTLPICGRGAPSVPIRIPSMLATVIKAFEAADALNQLPASPVEPPNSMTLLQSTV